MADSTGTPAILPLDGRDFPTHSWSGTAPKGATQAEVRLVQPHGKGKLVVESVSLSRADLVDVPLTFLAEAPGQLTVSDLRVTYDLPEPPTPLQLPDPVENQGRTLAVARPLATEPPTEAVVAPALPSVLANRSIGILAGVGDHFLSVFGGLRTPVANIAELAALDPEVEIVGISRERRLELKTKAEMVLGIAVEPALFAALASEPLEALLTLTPSELAQRAGQPVAKAEQILPRAACPAPATEEQRFPQPSPV